MIKKALAIEEKLGHQEGMANQYANLGTVAKAQGDLKRTRELWTKARDLYTRVGIPQVVTQMEKWLDELPKPAAKSKLASGGRGKSKATGKRKAKRTKTK